MPNVPWNQYVYKRVKIIMFEILCRHFGKDYIVPTFFLMYLIVSRMSSLKSIERTDGPNLVVELRFPVKNIKYRRLLFFNIKIPSKF